MIAGTPFRSCWNSASTSWSTSQWIPRTRKIQINVLLGCRHCFSKYSNRILYHFLFALIKKKRTYVVLLYVCIISLGREIQIFISLPEFVNSEKITAYHVPAKIVTQNFQKEEKEKIGGKRDFVASQRDVVKIMKTSGVPRGKVEKEFGVYAVRYVERVFSRRSSSWMPLTARKLCRMYLRGGGRRKHCGSSTKCKHLYK